MQTAEEDGSDIGNAVAIAVAKQQQAILTRRAAASPSLKHSEEEALDSFRIIRPFRSIGLRDQHITVGKYVKPARMVQITRECPHCDIARRSWRRVRTPPLCGDDLHHRNE